ncbi:MAG: hypothetical protein ACPLKQ_07235 [Candidatus Bathyarchaeales archaeon]
MKEVTKQVKGLGLGDLVCVVWFDASVGKSLSGGGLRGIDVPVTSWGVFLGVLGQKNRHIILAQNCFRYADGFYDIDYTAIPLSWASKITAVAKNHVPAGEANQLLNSFLMGSGKPRGCTKQQRVVNHGS